MSNRLSVSQQRSLLEMMSSQPGLDFKAALKIIEKSTTTRVTRVTTKLKN